MKKILVFMMALMVLVANVACAAQTPASESQKEVQQTEPEAQTDDTAEEDEIVIGLAMINHTSPSFVGILEGADEAAADYGCKNIWKSCEGNLDTQIDIVRGFIQQKVDVIMIDSVDVNGLVDVVNEATDAGIDVLGIGSPIPGKANYNATYPNKDDDTFIARFLGNLYKDEQDATIGLIIGTIGNNVSDSRQQAFEATMKNEFPQFNIVTGLGAWDPTTSMTAAADIINANNNIIHMHVIQDGMANGAIKAVQQSGKDITMTSENGDPEGIENVINGNYLMNNLTGNARIGYWFEAICYYIAKGQEMDTTQLLHTYRIMSEEYQQMAKDWEINYNDAGEELDMVTPEEAQKIASAYKQEFGPDVWIPTLTN